MEAYARALVPRLPALWPEARFLVFGARELAAEWRADPWHPEISFHAVPASAASRVGRTVAEQVLWRTNVDVLHSLANIAPLVVRGRSVVTVHDLIFKHFPDTHAGVLSRGVALLVAQTVRRADRIITDSASTADDLRRFYGIPDTRIDVVHLGRGADPVTPTPEPEIRERLGLRGPVVLSPSAHRPHKNLHRLIEAMRGLNATLVLPGYTTGEEATLRSEGVVVTGWLDQADLEGLYRLARCLVFPSLCEGFGLPVLEAMARDLPVACANATSLPEVAGDAAVLFDPYDVGAIRGAVAQLLTDDALCDALIARGRHRIGAFDWDRTAAATVAVYRKALS